MKNRIQKIFGKSAVAVALLMSAHHAANAQTVYWLESVTNKINKVTYTGTPVAASAATLVSNAGVPVYSVINRSTNEVYWSDNLSGTISKAPVAGGAATIVVSGITGTGVYIQGLYLDVKRNLLYWTETATGKFDKVRRVNFSGALPKLSTSATDIVTGIDIVRGVAVDTGSAAKVYFADAGLNTQGKGIYSVTYSGTTIAATAATQIAATPVAGIVVPQPQQLFLDRNNKFIYWSDYAAGTANIKRVSTNTGTTYPATPVAVYSGQSVRGVYINALENKIYWTEPKNNLIKTASLATIPITAPVNAVTGITGLARNLTYVAADLVVPVTFVSARAYPSGKNVNVEWTVASELNMAAYIVEKSADGINFREIGTLPPTGNPAEHDYMLPDVSPVNGNNYYRVVGVSIDGRRQYSPIMKVTINGTQQTDVVVYPNPVKPGEPINLQLQNAEKGIYNIAVYNKAGQLLYKEAYSHAGGTSFKAINLKNTGTGNYTVRITADNFKFSKEVIIK